VSKERPAPQGDWPAGELRFAIIAARFNATVVDALLEGALETLRGHGAPASHVLVVRVPGAYDIPVVARKLALSGRFDALIALGAVVRGETPHFDYVAGECAAGLMRLALQEGVPITFGVLTTDTMEQATDRAGGKAGNKGADAALAALELAHVLKRLDARAG
jgi:6,7-dimethyl-8-ribityllumazine synthase